MVSFTTGGVSGKFVNQLLESGSSFYSALLSPPGGTAVVAGLQFLAERRLSIKPKAVP